ncbi:MAG: transcriptional regulator NanR [Pseudomonadota bacterium]
MTTEPSPIRRKKLADQVEERILAFIREKRLKPGDTLPSERELMVQYQVGRPAIREAMQNLHRMGVAEIKHGERPRVAEPSFDIMAGQMALTMRHLLSHNATTMEHLKEARATFETQMARIAATRSRPGDIIELKQILVRQSELHADPHSFMEMDARFHAAVAAISGNPIFASLSQALFEWLAQFHIEMVQRQGLEKLTLAEHEAILSAIEARDADLAAKHMADHLNRANTLYHQDHLTT